jgi:GT2 family glycosyltransferase
VSVIVPNYNGAGLLRDCLGSVARQTYPGVEAIVVDDGSTDESVAIVHDEFPAMTLVQRPRNGGFARAVNAGIHAARGDIVALLNNDAIAEPTWLAELVDALDRHPEAGSVASKILLPDGRTVASAGDIFCRRGVPNGRGVWELDVGQFDDEVPVFGACGAACAYRRTMLDEVGLLDERFFMYCEDVDLAFRAQRRGFGCVYAPRAVVRHRVSATGGGVLASYQCGRNFVWLLAKDVPGVAWRRDAPRFLLTQLALAVAALRHFREPAARARLRGQIVGCLAVPQLVLERRRDVAPRVSDHYLLGLLT